MSLRSSSRACRALFLGAAVIGAAALAAPAAWAADPSAPGAPSVTGATAGVRSVTVSFNPPASDGGSPVFQYKVTCQSSDGGVTRSSSGGHSPIRVGDLTGSKTYTCTVAARNHVGLGPSSSPSSAVVTLPSPSVPGAPSVTGATPGVRSVTITFNPPTSDGGAPIFQYRVSCTSSDGGVARSNSTGHHTTVRVGGLTASKTYTCTVTARNRAGAGPASAPSAAVVTLAPPVVTAPGAPTITGVAAGHHSVTVTVTPPSNNGGATVDAYKATCESSNGGSTHSETSHHTTIRVDHLTAGKTYTCTAAAHNRKGFGPSSAPSAAVVPLS